MHDKGTYQQHNSQSRPTSAAIYLRRISIRRKAARQHWLYLARKKSNTDIRYRGSIPLTLYCFAWIILQLILAKCHTPGSYSAWDPARYVYASVPTSIHVTDTNEPRRNCYKNSLISMLVFNLPREREIQGLGYRHECACVHIAHVYLPMYVCRTCRTWFQTFTILACMHFSDHMPALFVRACMCVCVCASLCMCVHIHSTIILNQAVPFVSFLHKNI